MKKVLSLFCCLLFIISFTFTVDTYGLCPCNVIKANPLTIGFVTDQGGIHDGSFNESANAGLVKASKDLGIVYKHIETTGYNEYEPNLNTFVNDKADLICSVSFMMKDAIDNVSMKNPNSKFLIIDDVIENPNVLSMTFKENEGSFLMGVIAGKMTKTSKVGFIGGFDGELIQRFEAGFAAGVKSVNPSNRSLVKYAGSFSDEQIGKEIAKGLIDEGCDVIYHAAGAVGMGMFDAVKEAREKGKDVWAIGVDIDQSAILTDYKDVILSSMVKNIDKATYLAASQLVNKTLVTGKHMELGLKEDAVGLAPSTKNFVPKSVLDLVEKYKKAVIDGKIIVPKDINELKNFKAVQL